MELAEAAAIYSDFRKAHQPVAGDDNARLIVCRECGAEFWRWVRDDRTYCADCGAARMLNVWRSRRAAARQRWLERYRTELDAAERAARNTPGRSR